MLTNLLIRDLKILNGEDKFTQQNDTPTNLQVYETFLQKTCKIRFKWHEDLSYQDLTGPEKIKLFEKIDIPTLFPRLKGGRGFLKPCKRHITNRMRLLKYL